MWFTSLILKLYLTNVEYLVGLDFSCAKLLNARRLKLYDDLVVADARMLPFKDRGFDLVISIEVIHGVSVSTLESIEACQRNSIVLALPMLPKGVSAKRLIEKGYSCYRYLLRGSYS